EAAQPEKHQHGGERVRRRVDDHEPREEVVRREQRGERGCPEPVDERSVGNWSYPRGELLCDLVVRRAVPAATAGDVDQRLRCRGDDVDQNEDPRRKQQVASVVPWIRRGRSHAFQNRGETLSGG